MTCPGLVKIRLELLATTFLSSKIEADSFEYHDSYRRGCDPTHWSVSPVATSKESGSTIASQADYQDFGRVQLEVYDAASFGWVYWTLKD
uniref:uncharacterized protein LOC101299869 isoform X3 n=1 Tax=Fragaria vesca subsp. vesca TaxID=101020 RepID=UPI0005C97D86|nr:PREDICTED: uncharacterized protein LOC101299869 isoform X3 [Fragaria vesca subsp. vesca]